MEASEDKITKASQSTDARFKRKKIWTMKREADKITEKLRVPKDLTLKRHPQNRNECIEAKMAEINKKIRRAKNGRNQQHLIAK